MSHKHHGKLAIEYSLPAGCEMLTFPRTDGDANLWPPNQVEEEDEDGNVNFYMPLPDDTGSSLKWLHLVGQKVSEEMGLPKDKKYAFASWPEGYRFFDHHKGAKASPRHDPYLIGCTNVNRFRSVPEFVPHALWLMTDVTMDRANCTCKYCSKRKQSAVSQQYGYSTQASRGSALPTASQSPSKRQRRTQQPYAVVQRTKALKAQTEQAQAAKKRKREKAQENQRLTELEPPEHTMHNERVADLSAASMRLGPERGQRRYHRQGELVWCLLSAPIRAGPPGDAPSITFWPAVIRQWETVIETVPREYWEPPQPGPLSDEDLARIQAGRPNVPAGHHYAGESQAAVPHVTVHRTRYKAQLLAINAHIAVLDDCVLPYAAWAPPSELLGCLRDVPAHALQYARDFCPPLSIPELSTQQEIEAAFARAAAPYSIALEAAAELAATWSVTDEWTAYTVNPASGGEEQEMRYQGLWWGPERIWAGDLVQLKMPRKQLHGPQLHEPYVSENQNEPGAEDRGVFMHLRVIKSQEVRRADGSVRDEICISGELYEVAEDPTFSGQPPTDRIIPQDERDEVRQKIVDAAKKAQERDIDEAARAVEGLDMSANGNGKGKEREDATMRPASDVAPAPVADVTLPNPDPTVPIDQTVPAMLNALGDAPPPATPPTTTNGTTRPDGGLLSGPSNNNDLLPPAPPAFTFRPLLKQPGDEAAISLDLLGGRYYPGIVNHPLLNNIRLLAIEQAQSYPNEPLPLECEAVLALEGVAPGMGCAMSPSRHVQGRKTAIEEAERQAESMLKTNWEGRTGGMANGNGQAGGSWGPGPGPGLEGMFGMGDGMDVDLNGFV